MDDRTIIAMTKYLVEEVEEACHEIESCNGARDAAIKACDRDAWYRATGKRAVWARQLKRASAMLSSYRPAAAAALKDGARR